MAKISAVLTVYNEEKSIERCLKSLQFADEIIVVDNESEDKTAEIAKKYTSKVFTQKNNPLEIDIQKNFGFEKALNEWILSIDADEEVSKELTAEIKKILGAKPSSISQINGFWIPRKNFIFGKWIENAGWYPDYQLRLFRKQKGKYTKKHVHESLSLEGETAKLKEHIIHHNYSSIQQFLDKTFTYAQNEAEELLSKGYEFSYFDAIKFPLSEFLSRFFARKGYKDGFHGLMLSLFMAFYHFVIFAFIWEKRDFPQYNSKEFLSETENEFKKAGKEIIFWISKEKLENIKNPLKRNLQKISKKIRGL
ncbi:MAG: glycosyltransferase family 2 protein [Candidatus Levybacteria bacterium CG10_big_fil_rev_8_21_14_0_10_35_13]|nr:MAG: glycosyltransferase family 2 protein [Candidatus Levybacteria bacterium CG10_big_fil_rev_8_21_14_0_10_35_13]